MKTIRSALNEICDKFKLSGIENPELDARLLVQNVLGIRYEELLLNNNKIINIFECDRLIEMTQRRLSREPVSRIIGSREFWKFKFKVSRETLDPRADSEILVEAALKFAKEDVPLTILDLGTGTGCLLLSLLHELPQATGIGIDISEDAVRTAQENAESLNLSDRSSFEVGDWSEMTTDKPFDIVISNPPYISEAEMPMLAPEVREYDPRRALVGGVDGLDCYRDIAALLPRLITTTGRAFLEIGATQAISVKEILAGRGLHVLETVQDLAGHDRCLMAQLEPGCLNQLNRSEEKSA